MKKIKIDIQTSIGMSILLFGVSILLNGLLLAEKLAPMLPSLEKMGADTALLFIVSGLACALHAGPGPMRGWRRVGSIVATAYIVAVPLLDIAMNIAVANLGHGIIASIPQSAVIQAKQEILHANTSIAFLMVGLSFFFASAKVRTKINNTALWLCVHAVMLIATSALIGRLLKLESLYRISAFNIMDMPVAAALCILSAGLWLLLKKTVVRNLKAISDHKKRIVWRSIVVLALVALGAGMTGFSMMRESFEDSFSEHMVLRASLNAEAIASTLKARLAIAEAVANQSALLVLTKDRAALPELKEHLNSLAPTGLTGIRIFDSQGTAVAQSGMLLSDLSLHHTPIAVANKKAILIWQDGYVLHVENDLIANGRKIGAVITEDKMVELNRIIKQMWGTNEFADALLCARIQNLAVCSPSRFYAQPIAVPMFDAEGKSNKPGARALLGEVGIDMVNDLRGTPVFAAYTPIREFGLSLVLKVDEESLYAPLKQRINMIVVLMAILVIMGTIALRIQVQPFLNHIVREQKRMNLILGNSHDAFISLNQHGIVTDWNSQAKRTFGWTAEEAIGRSLGALIIPENLQGVHHADQDAFWKSGSGAFVNKRIEMAVRHKNGRELPVEMSVATFQDGRAHAVNIFLRDITERKEAEHKLLESERRLSAIANNIPAMIAHVGKDQRYIYINRYIEKSFGVKPDMLIGKTVEEMTGVHVYNNIKHHIDQVLSGKSVSFGWVADHNENGTYYQSRYVPDIDEVGNINGFYAMTHDITEIKKNEVRAAQSELRLRTITDNLPVLITYIDKDHRVQFSNATSKAWLDLDPHQMIGLHLQELFDGKIYEERKAHLEQALTGQRVNFEIRTTTHGTPRDLRTSYIPDYAPDGTVVGVYTISIDITEMKKVENQLSQLARFDTLTGLPNRYQLNEKLKEAMERNKRAVDSMAVMYLDIDLFKSINDTYGHAAGDAVLKEFASRLKNSVRTTDTVARLSGDEFIIVLEGLHEVHEASSVAAKIVDAVNKEWLIGGLPLKVTTSIGGAYLKTKDLSASELIARADKALYDAKAAGRNNYVIHPCE